MKRRIAILCAVAASSLCACSGTKAGGARGIPETAPIVLIKPGADLQARTSPMKIIYADQIGDFLEVRVSYSGGCAEHNFTLVSKGKHTATYPPEVEVAFQHDDAGDPCRSMVDEKRYFDLTPLRYPGTNRVLIVLTNTRQTITYTY